MSIHQRQLVNVPIELLKTSPNKPRQVFEDIDSLAETIRHHGLLEPLIVRQLTDKYGYEIVIGERRLLACQKAGLKEVPCIVTDETDKKRIMEMQLIENIQRADLKVFEEVEIVETLRDQFGLTQKEIAVETGLSHGTIGNYLEIAKLPKEIQQQIVRDAHDPKALNISKALTLARAQLPSEKLEHTTKLITKEGLTQVQLTKKLAVKRKTKIERVMGSRSFWKELMRSPREFANYWEEYATLKEWEDVRYYHAELKVQLPKDLQETEEEHIADRMSSGKLPPEEAPQICGACGEDILEGDEFMEKDGLYYHLECT